MITKPICKINLGLNVVERRPDGYHNLETVFYPVPIFDALEVFPMDQEFPSPVECTPIYIKVYPHRLVWAAVQAIAAL